MAIIRALPSGELHQFFASYQLSQQFAVDPAAIVVLDFDESTNPALAADLSLSMLPYMLAIVNGTPQLQKNGVAVSIAAPSAVYSLQSAIFAGVPDATLKATIVALWAGTATAQQQQKALASCLLKLHQAGLI